MPDVEVNQTNVPPPQPPQQPPPVRDDSSRAIWPIVVALLVVALVIIWFIFVREDAEPARLDRTEVNVNLPDVETPEVEIPESIEVEVPDQVDVDIDTGDAEAPPEASGGEAPPAVPPPSQNR
ncbi:MAG TPA: hypothetical protein VM557_01645 [Thermoanaerobaculia bacterium]|nr:hypothetical protein [Thermoanaerobaculia bacterium]